MKVKSNAKGIIILLISQSLVKVFGIVYKLYLANKKGFGDEGNAIYNSGYQIYALLLTISTIGVPSVISKLVAENRGNKDKVHEIMKNALFLFSFIGIIAAVVLAVSSSFVANNILNIPEAHFSILALAPAIYNVCLISVIRGYYNGMGKVEFTAKSQTLEQVLKTIFTISFVEVIALFTGNRTDVMAAWANMATTMATLGSLVYLYKKLNIKKNRSDISIRKMNRILRMTIPISASVILASLNRNIDSVTIVRYLKKFVDESLARKQYGILSGKIDVIASVPVSFIIATATLIIPEVANKKINTGIEQILSKYMKLALTFIIPCSMYMFFQSDEILYFLFGSKDGSMYLKISAITIMFVAVEQIINAVLQGIGKIYVPACALTMGVICKAVLNRYLLNFDPSIFWYGGITGCCLATLICHFVAFAISFEVLKKKIKINSKIFKFLLKPIGASCIMTMTLRYAQFFVEGILNKKIAIIVSSAIAVSVYIALILIFGVIKEIICVKYKI